MPTEKLYAYVSKFMNEHGVKQKPVEITLLNDRFGEANIKKLIQKSYLIKVGLKAVTIGK
jgi:hypothetical protein